MTTAATPTPAANESSESNQDGRRGDGLFMARERHLQALRRVGDHLAASHALLQARAEHLDLLAEELRLAQHALSEITGEFTADDLLGEIFSRFCIGK